MNNKYMEEDRLIIESLQADGYCCTQIIIKIVLDRLGEENGQMVKAVSALCGGMKTGHNCGVLPGIAMALALMEARCLGLVMEELIEWFANTYGSINCIDIVGKEGNRLEICPALIQDTYFKALEIIKKYGGTF